MLVKSVLRFKKYQLLTYTTQLSAQGQPLAWSDPLRRQFAAVLLALTAPAHPIDIIARAVASIQSALLILNKTYGRLLRYSNAVALL